MIKYRAEISITTDIKGGMIGYKDCISITTVYKRVVYPIIKHREDF